MGDIKKWQEDFRAYIGGLLILREDYRGIMEYIDEVPTIEPEITDEQAIEHLQSTGWLQNHDREMYESGLREQLADDSGSYDSLIPCEDTISRQAAIDAIDFGAELLRRVLDDTDFVGAEREKFEWGLGLIESCISDVKELPSAHPERKKGEVDI